MPVHAAATSLRINPLALPSPSTAPTFHPRDVRRAPQSNFAGRARIDTGADMEPLRGRRFHSSISARPARQGRGSRASRPAFRNALREAPSCAASPCRSPRRGWEPDERDRRSSATPTIALPSPALRREESADEVDEAEWSV